MQRVDIAPFVAYIGVGTIFWLMEQNLAKNNQDNQIQNSLQLYAICIF